MKLAGTDQQTQWHISFITTCLVGCLYHIQHILSANIHSNCVQTQ